MGAVFAAPIYSTIVLNVEEDTHITLETDPSPLSWVKCCTAEIMEFKILNIFFFLMDLLIGQHSDNKQETGCTGLEPQATAERTMLLHMGCPPYQRS